MWLAVTPRRNIWKWQSFSARRGVPPFERQIRNLHIGERIISRIVPTRLVCQPASFPAVDMQAYTRTRRSMAIPTHAGSSKPAFYPRCCARFPFRVSLRRTRRTRSGLFLDFTTRYHRGSSLLRVLADFAAATFTDRRSFSFFFRNIETICRAVRVGSFTRIVSRRLAPEWEFVA